MVALSLTQLVSMLFLDFVSYLCEGDEEESAALRSKLGNVSSIMAVMKGIRKSNDGVMDVVKRIGLSPRDCTSLFCSAACLL